ncbi:MAG: hypothetical protein FD126_2204 [Elusimicrobia bacterium]|nr:MAG: hypothetical protein FD126_2204 [Elusimicrobiota bacterium]
MDNSFRVGKLTEALVAANMTGSADPYAMAAKTIRETVHVALRAIPAWDPSADLAIEEAVRGGIQALVLADLDVARGGYLTLCEMTDMAHELGRDPGDTLLCAMRGIVSLRRLVPDDQMVPRPHRSSGLLPRVIGGTLASS